MANLPQNYETKRTPQLFDFGTVALSLSGGAARDTTNFADGTGSLYIPQTAGLTAIGDVTGISANFNGLESLMVLIYRPPGMKNAILHFYFTHEAAFGANYMDTTIIVDKDGWNYYALNTSNMTTNGTGNLGATPVQLMRFREDSLPATVPNWSPGEYLRIGGVYTGWRSRPKFLICVDDGPSGLTVDGGGAGYPVSGKNYKAILDYYGFKGTTGINNGTVGTSGKTTWAALTTLQAAGWSVVNHTEEHPVDIINAGLRVLGPYGRNRVLSSADPTTDVLTASVAQNFSAGSAIYFTGATLPAPIVSGQPYYTSANSGVTFKICNTEADAVAGINFVNIASNGSGRIDYVGATDDETGIYDSIVACRDELKSRGYTGADILILPQGGFDYWVGLACTRAGARMARGVLDGVSTQPALPMGRQTGVGSLGAFSGAMEIPSSLGTPVNQATIDAYVDELERVGGTGSCYYHGIDGAIATGIDLVCQRLRKDARLGLIDVVTGEEWVNGLTNPRKLR